MESAHEEGMVRCGLPERGVQRGGRRRRGGPAGRARILEGDRTPMGRGVSWDSEWVVNAAMLSATVGNGVILIHITSNKTHERRK